jgi:hypothetical protein
MKTDNSGRVLVENSGVIVTPTFCSLHSADERPFSRFFSVAREAE